MDEFSVTECVSEGHDVSEVVEGGFGDVLDVGSEGESGVQDDA